MAEKVALPPGALGIFEFTPEDLRANQRGTLTDKQRGWLRGTARGIRSCSTSSAAVGLGFVLFGMLLTLGLYMSNEDSRRAFFASPVNLLVFAGAGVVAVSAIGLSILLARRRAAAVAAGVLKAVQGPVRLDQEYSSGAGFTSYYVHVGDHKFSFSDDMSGVFREGEAYRVYYCGSGPYQMIMSFERLTPG